MAIHLIIILIIFKFFVALAITKLMEESKVFIMIVFGYKKIVWHKRKILKDDNETDGED